SANPEFGVSPWVAAVHLHWPIETAGKRRHRIERASADAQARRIAVWGEAWRIRHQLASVIIELDAARGRLRALRLDLAAAEHLGRLLEERVASGSASTRDLAPMRFALLQSRAELAA